MVPHEPRSSEAESISPARSTPNRRVPTVDPESARPVDSNDDHLEATETTPPAQRGRLLLVIAVLLLVALSLWWGWSTYRSQSAVPTPTPAATPKPTSKPKPKPTHKPTATTTDTPTATASPTDTGGASQSASP